MKRRGFSPTTRTFQTFFNGLSRIEDWSTHSKQLTNARSLYDAYQRHISSVKKFDPGNSELLIDPLAGYIRILGNAGRYQEVFDIYYAMDQEGPLSPNQFIFTAMFHAIVAAKNNVSEGAAKVAADARLLWNQMNKASTRSPGFTIDSFSVVAALNALSGGNQADHDLAFQITTKYFGLIPDQPKSEHGILPLRPESFAAILKLCNQTKRHELCSQFLQQVRSRQEDAGGVSIIDRLHIEEVLRGGLALGGSNLAYRALQTLEWMLRQEIIGANGPKIRPALSTYNIVVQACRCHGDWRSATRTFDLMTGYHSHDFMDGSVAETPRQDKRGPGRSFPPNAEFMSRMVQTALTTKNHANIRQSLRMVDYLGFENILNVQGAGESKNATKILKNKAFFGSKFSSAISEAVKFISDKRPRPLDWRPPLE
jgi:pentatricopeptide repeat protein